MTDWDAHAERDNSAGAEGSSESEHQHGHVHAHVAPEEYAVSLRAAKDEFMREDSSSPLGTGKAAFTGLRYFPYDYRFAFTLAMDKNVSTETVQMGTSTGENQEYARFGRVQFEVDGQPAELMIYGEPDDLFLPLRDATSGKETYGAGRYISPALVDEHTVFVDFNLLYNPYCAYNEQFSCPLPPTENWISVPIRAGEQVYLPVDHDA